MRSGMPSAHVTCGRFSDARYFISEMSFFLLRWGWDVGNERTSRKQRSNDQSQQPPDDPQKVQQCRSRFCQQLHTMPPHDARILARIGTARTTSSAKVILDQK